MRYQNLQSQLEESNSLPNSVVPFISLAILPSKASSIDASSIKITANLKFKSKENFIELIPKHTPAIVKILGKIYLVFLTELS